MLSKNGIARLQSQEKEYVVYDSQFLYLRVYPSGKKKWIFRRRVDGKDKQATLGEYPDMGILEARCARDAALNADKERKTAGMPLGELFELWTKERRVGQVIPSIVIRDRQVFEKIPELKSRGVRSITRIELISILRKKISERSLNTSYRLAETLKLIFDFAVDIGELEEPHSALRLLRALPKRPSSNRLSIHDPVEIGRLLRALEFIKPERVKIALKVIAYTFIRYGELRKAEWYEVDLENAIWTIPAENTKKRRDHVVPLSRQVIELLNSLPRGKNTDSIFGYLTTDRLLAALERLQRLPPELRPEKIHVHGFRSMASTILNEHEWPSDAIERQLAHVSGGVRAVYNKAQYLETRRRMLQWYADYLDSLRDGTPEPEMPANK